MKKLIPIVIMLIALSIKASAQNTDLDRWAQKTTSTTTQTPQVNKKNLLFDAGVYLEKSAKMGYTSLTLAGIGSTVCIGGAFMKDKFDEEKMKIKTNNGRIACFATAGVCGVAAIICGVKALEYKMKAGSSLKMIGSGLAYNF